MKPAPSSLHTLIRDWVRARSRWGAQSEPVPPLPPSLEAVGVSLDALRQHGPDQAWEAELEDLPPPLGLELRRWRFHSPDVEVDASHRSGLPFAQTWWLPFALWDDAAFVGDTPAEALSSPVLLQEARTELDKVLGDVHRSAGALSGLQVSLDAGVPLDADLAGQSPLPEGAATTWPLERIASLQLQRGQKWLNAGLLPLTLRASSSAALAWVGAWLSHRLGAVRQERGRLGRPADLRSALSEAGVLRWGLWSDQLLKRAGAPAAQLAMSLTVVRWKGQLLELRGLAHEEGPSEGPRLWRGHVCLFEEQETLRRALEPWLRLENPSVRLQIQAVEEAVLASSWEEPFDPHRHRLH